jgi:hypothetical protein
MKADYSRYFWQLRELQRTLDLFESQRRALSTISPLLNQQLAELSNIRDRFTLPREYLQEVARVQEALEARPSIDQLPALRHLESSSLQELIRGQEEIDELMRRFDAVANIELPSQRILESLASTEALLESHRMSQDLAEAAIRPHLELQDFVRRQLALADFEPSIVQEKRLQLIDVATDLLGAMGEGLELGLLMSEVPSEMESLPAVNIYAELAQAVEDVNLESAEVNVESVAAESAPVRIATLGSQIVQLIYDLNVEAEREGKKPVFKPTNKTQFACVVIPTHVASDQLSFSLVVDSLYFLLYEGSGEAKRLLEMTSEDKIASLWSLKHLRNSFRHDLDHGSDAEVSKKNRRIGETYMALIGSVAPRTQADWARAQVALYGELVKMLELLWYGEETESDAGAGEKEESLLDAVPGRSPYPLRGLPIRYDDPTEPVAEDDWEVLQ